MNDRAPRQAAEQVHGKGKGHARDRDRFEYLRRCHVDPIRTDARPWTFTERIVTLIRCRPRWHLRHLDGEPPYGQDLPMELWDAIDPKRLADVQAELYLGWPRRVARRLALSLADVLAALRKGG